MTKVIILFGAEKYLCDSITYHIKLIELMGHIQLSSTKVLWFNRISLFIIFFWFGFLKVIGVSPAEKLVTDLHHATIARFVSIEQFLIFFGIFECLIGLLWLFPKLTRSAFYVFIIQMITTFLPLFYLPDVTWQKAMVLSLTGQYIVKNVALIALALNILIAEKGSLEPRSLYHSETS